MTLQLKYMMKLKELLGDNMNDVIELIKKDDICKIYENVSISKYTTYRVGGICRVMAYPTDVSELIKLLKLLKSRNIKYKILGNGSNLLFSDKEYDGFLIKLNSFDTLTFLGNNKVKVGAGYSLIKLSLMAAKKGYVVETVKVLTPNLEIINLENKEMNFHYRSSFLQTHRDYVCLEVILKLNVGKREAIEDVIRERRERRVVSQPLEYPSAGSVFRNPEGGFAGQLIEESGLKGMTKGGAMISDKHANFVINYKDATSSDIKYLIDLAHDTVLEKYNVDMKIEQEFVNWE